MQTARVTVLMEPERKTAVEEEASAFGVSTGEYIRLAIDNFSTSETSPEEELSALTKELATALPDMQASLDRSAESLSRMHDVIDGFLRQVGARP